VSPRASTGFAQAGTGCWDHPLQRQSGPPADTCTLRWPADVEAGGFRGWASAGSEGSERFTGGGGVGPRPAPLTAAGPNDVEAVRRDFPIPVRTVRKRQPWSYRDSGGLAAPDGRPHASARVLRAAPRRAHGAPLIVMRRKEAPRYLRGDRAKVASFLRGSVADAVVFTKSATEGITWSRRVGLVAAAGDEMSSRRSAPCHPGCVGQQLAIGTGRR